MIDDIFATRVFEKFDTNDKTMKDLCDRMTVMETIHTENEKKITEHKLAKRDNQKWYLGIVSFVFFAYIAIKEITNG